MVEQGQHGSRLQRAFDHAERAIKEARDTEIAVHQAKVDSNPSAMMSARQKLTQAKQGLEEAEEHLHAAAQVGQTQEIKSMMNNIEQAEMNLDAFDTSDPKQVR